MNLLEQLAELIFSDVTETIEDLEKRYPERNLSEDALVTRFAPSPTGFLHTGSLFTSLIGFKTEETWSAYEGLEQNWSFLLKINKRGVKKKKRGVKRKIFAKTIDKNAQKCYNSQGPYSKGITMPI